MLLLVALITGTCQFAESAMMMTDNMLHVNYKNIYVIMANVLGLGRHVVTALNRLLR